MAVFVSLGKYDGPGKGLASRACNWYINSRPGFRVSMNFEFFSVEGDPPCKKIKLERKNKILF